MFSRLCNAIFETAHTCTVNSLITHAAVAPPTPNRDASTGEELMTPSSCIVSLTLKRNAVDKYYLELNDIFANQFQKLKF